MTDEPFLPASFRVGGRDVGATAVEHNRSTVGDGRPLKGTQTDVASGQPRALLLIAFCAFAPIILISIVSWLYFRNAGLSFSISSLHETWEVLKSFFISAPANRVDSWGPMLQGLHVLQAGGEGSLYKTLFFEGGIRFQYPPSSLLPIDLFTRLGIGTPPFMNGLNSALFLVNALGVAFLAHLSALKLPAVRPLHRETQAHWAIPVVAFAASFCFYPAIHAVILGQIQVWIDLLVTLACIAWLYDRRALAGAMIGATCAIKPQFGVLLLWALCWREWMFAKGILFVSLPIALVSLALYGVTNSIAYFDVLSFLSKHGESFYANNSINGIVNRYIGNGNNLNWTFFEFTPFNAVAYYATICASLIALGLIIAPALLRHGKATIFDFGAATILAVTGSPVAWEHHYGIMLPLYVLLLQAMMYEPASRSQSWRLGALASSWFLSANLMPFANLLADTKLNFLQSYLFFGALMLVVLLLIQAERTKTRFYFNPKRDPDPARTFSKLECSLERL